MDIIYTKHAKEMLVFRNIDKTLIKKCIENPDQILPAREGKHIYLRNFGKNYLKAVVAQEENVLIIITIHWLAKKRIKK